MEPNQKLPSAKTSPGQPPVDKVPTLKADPISSAGRLPAAPPVRKVLPPRAESVAASVVTAPRPPKSGRVRVAVLAVLFAGTAAGAWWWMKMESSTITGRVSLAGGESGRAEIRVFRREDLSAAWRELLATAEVRAAELADLSTGALARHRQAWLAYDEAARVCAVGEEYNMPDLAELRAERDLQKGGETVAMEELERLSAEKQGLVTLEGFLRAVPEPLLTLVADDEGNFLLPRPDSGGVVLLATSSAESDGRVQSGGWLEVLEPAADGRLPDAVELSDEDHLDVETIRGFAAMPAPSE